MKKNIIFTTMLLLSIMLLSLSGLLHATTVYYNGDGEVIEKPEGLIKLKENLFRDNRGDVYFVAPYVKNLPRKNYDAIAPTVLGTMLQQYWYDRIHDSLVPLVKVIDIKTYQLVDGFIYKDKRHVYLYRGSENMNYPFIIMDELTSDDITVVGGDYLISNNKVYYYGGIQYISEVKGVDALTFSTFRLKTNEGDGYLFYGKDKNRCYFRGDVLNSEMMIIIVGMTHENIHSDCQ